MKLTKPTEDGKFRVNKEAVIAKLAQATRRRNSTTLSENSDRVGLQDLGGVVEASPEIIESECHSMTRYSADAILIKDESEFDENKND